MASVSSCYVILIRECDLFNPQSTQVFTTIKENNYDLDSFALHFEVANLTSVYSYGHYGVQRLLCLIH